MFGAFKRSFVIAVLLIAGFPIDPVTAGQRITLRDGGPPAGAQEPSPPTATQPAASRDAAPLTLQAALAAARTNSPQFRSALLASGIAAEDRTQAKAALLPSLNGFAQYIYTTPNGTPSGVFVANNGPHEYITWGQVHGDLFAPGKRADFHRAQAAAASARAKADVAARGLVATVVQAYYGLVAAERRAANARQSLREAQQFLDISQRQERGGEVAHSDVVKAQIQVAQRQRDAADADLAFERNRIGLAVLIFPDFREDFTVVDDLLEALPLRSLGDVRAAAAEASPDLRAAQASLNAESFGVSVARSGLLPSVSFDYYYGIDANEFALHNMTPDHNRNLGSWAQAQMTIPLWNWGATQSRLRQAELRVEQAKADLTLTQRQLLANVSAFYREALTARDQVTSLRESLDLATESLRLTLLRYQAGEISVLEVVDAQSTLALARNAYDDGLVRYRVALAALQTLTGSL
jgi:outer membrane protein TolC